MLNLLDEIYTRYFVLFYFIIISRYMSYISAHLYWKSLILCHTDQWPPSDNKD